MMTYRQRVREWIKVDAQRRLDAAALEKVTARLSPIAFPAPSGDWGKLKAFAYANPEYLSAQRVRPKS